MLKLYELWTNTGDWDGIVTEYVIAESKEEAISLVSEFIDNDVDDYVIEETMTEEPLIVKTFEEDEEEK